MLRVLHKALEACGLTQSELAERLRVRKSAVSQALRGDGNLRVNTIASYLSAMGYELDVRLVEAGEPRKAVLEGREVHPSFTQDWIPVDDSRSEHLRGENIEVHFAQSHFTVTLVEMHRTSAEPLRNVLYDFEGTAQSTEPVFAESREFHPIRTGAAS
ncbi:helix-turn-helix domain-containing protein [Streptomyces sp. ISL-1]|uniref:helix-turn-helix domain-containing protein n=1 Tax=Streptomyces sp. ISL-1 TaxID=2817657 RepID=UPI0035AB8514